MIYIYCLPVPVCLLRKIVDCLHGELNVHSPGTKYIPLYGCCFLLVYKQQIASSFEKY